MNVINRFADSHRFLSNFYPSPLVYEDIAYRTVEHAYQASKTTDRELRELMSRLSTAADAKEIGKLLPKREDWHDVKESIMAELVVLKFAEGSTLAKRLLLTYPMALVEGNYWHDTFWGVCTCEGKKTPKCPGGGSNKLGLLLAYHREYLWQHSLVTT
jgi:ribA/ribD-fused uncharacterized protein